MSFYFYIFLGFNERFVKLEKKVEDVSSKLDVVIMNQVSLNRHLLPEQAIISRPSNLPPLPLNDMKRLEEFEKFISKDINLSAAVCNIFHVYLQVNIVYLLIYLSKR